MSNLPLDYPHSIYSTERTIQEVIEDLELCLLNNELYASDIIPVIFSFAKIPLSEEDIIFILESLGHQSPNAYNIWHYALEIGLVVKDQKTDHEDMLYSLNPLIE